ncbi:hypothetical protein K2173_008423 [Erythroxylum novogranatense]|uniref:BAG family molecular chaperone regulator 4 n=1 Tax=Erythroxylum novogranatense TaxID=1862640 RepID=A0AAV8UA56_9ROSI|nr:hypothetical protein K2173_008423 [Erythroxylum novogranatense]
MMNSATQHDEANWDCEVRSGGMCVQRRDADDHLDQSGPLIKVSVSHGASPHEVHVPPHSTFGYMKKVIEQKTGLEPNRQKILFRGQEKEDVDYLNEAGVKDNSKVLVLEDTAKEPKLEQLKECNETSKAGLKENAETWNKEQKEAGIKESEEMLKALQAIDVVRAEVDKLAERVAALEVAVNGGTKIAEDEFVVSAELLMRQMLKLDTIEAEGEARIQRKAEVRRIQKFHEVLDNLKVKNSKPHNKSESNVTVTTEWETFDSGMGSLTPPPPTSSSTRVTQDWETFD